MGLMRAVPLKNASVSPTTADEFSTAFDLSSLMTAGLKIYGALHMFSITSGDVFKGMIQSASSSGFGTPTTEIMFTSRSTAGAEWGTPVAIGSTSRIWFRAKVDITSGVGTATPSFRHLIEVGIQA